MRTWESGFGISRSHWPARMVALLLVFGIGVFAQEAPRAPETAAPAVPPNRGLQLRSVSAYGVYYSTTLPGSGGYQAAPAGLDGDVALGGSAQIEWMHTGQRSTVSLLYTPSYTGRIRYSAWNALNHALAFSATRRIAKWSVRSSVSADLSNFEGFLFSPTVYGNAASASANFSDLSGAMLGRTSGNIQVSSILNGAPVAESPARTLLYGERMFTSAAQVSLSYSYSPRFTVDFSSGAGRNQHLGDAQTTPATSRYLLPSTTSGTGSVGISYAVSPRTQFGVTAATNRVVSDLYDSYATTTAASLGRTFARRWVVRIHGGVGVTTPVRQKTAAQSSGAHPVWGGSLGFRTYAHTFLGSYDRTVSDGYGVGATTTSTSNANWRWNRPGNSWWLNASSSWQQLEGISSQNTSSWRAIAGWGRTLGRHFACIAEYAYLDYSGRMGSTVYSRSQSAVRVSMVWLPQPALTR